MVPLRLPHPDEPLERLVTRMIDYSIPTEEFMHPLDQAMQEKILHLPLIRQWLEGPMREELDKACTQVYRSSCLRLNESSPWHAALEEAAELFGLRELPDLYIIRSYELDLRCAGYSKAAILIPSALMDRGDAQAIRWRIFAQAAGIAAGHHKIAFLNWVLDTMTGVIPLPVVDTLLEGALYEWERSRVYTLDRAVLAASGSLETALRNVLYGTMPDEMLQQYVFGRGSQDTFAPQVARFLDDSGVINKAAGIYGFLQQSSWLPARYHELEQYWHQTR